MNMSLSRSRVGSEANSEHTVIADEDVRQHDETKHEPTEEENIAGDDGILVDWAVGDPENPRNWSNAYKFWVTFLLGMMALACSMGSAIPAPATDAIASYLNLSSEVALLQVSLYILGFSAGPLIWGPVSEVWGRRVSMLPALFCLAVLSIGTAVSQNAAAVFITRFIGGVFGSAAVSNVTAALGDIWEPGVRGYAVTFYSIMVVGGPTIGPVIGSAILVNPKLGWRWTEYVQAIWAIATFAVCVFALPEVYSPVLLKKRAVRLRKETGDSRYYHPHEHATLDARAIITKHFSRPLKMLATEPVVTSIAFYASFVYGMLYLTLEVFPIVFQEIRGMDPVSGSLPFLGLFVGVLLAVPGNLANQPRYQRLSKEAGGKPVPDARLPPIIVSGVFFATGLFWFGWTAGPQYSIWNPIIAAVFIGAGFNIIFNQCLNVLVDTYGLLAASATSANTFLRSLLAAGFPLAAKPMFHNLGVGPAMSILGAVATAMIFVPFLMIKYGPALRRRSKMAAVN